MDDKFFILRTERPYIMGISIIAVFLFHIVSFSNIYRGFNFNILTYGYLGVDAFLFYLHMVYVFHMRNIVNGNFI